ncbi:NAD(P)/FAD-dependent oxidoreductase [Paenibacillus aceris]|uniref:Rossmann fold flavoprotein n=1 Tax=Paenibacillus aceris TaxID=869555 RepID=A0ABS4I1A2_9BACL|nr:NAD(P)/FAD-dependent oxidoreductase [Paenibacillus aceris]MBP1964694.1 putative Rossmann fold flavoprotein [Paenibacillus aceris]NHW33681.1 NAD(P)/FAD-dependent oxidoreductase [Paenibacillus aceris]
MTYDVIVIGGGSAGLMASIAASRQGAKVLLLDKGDKLGRKLGISGGGRCNVTNNKDMDDLIKHIPGNGRFLYSALTQFGNRHIIDFFEGLGIRLKEEDNGRMFPVSDKAKTVVDALIGQVRKQGVEIRMSSPVKRVLYQDGSVQGVLLHSGEKMNSRAVVIASGGCSVPHTGSTGDGYAWAEAGGHTITQLFPTEVPLTSKEAFIRSRELQGLSLREVTLSVWNAKGKVVISHRGDMLFTHFGLSGPIALRCSQFVVKELAKTERREVLLTVDLFPDLSMDDLYKESMALAKADAKKAIKNVLKPLLSERLIPMLLERSGLDDQLTYDNIPKQKWLDLCKLMKAFPVHIHGTLSIEEAFVTGGGVHLKEIDPSTMQSKLVNGLYFCGEVLDIHGYTGGYNITAAFSTGYMAGLSAAQQ